jgi:autotransporter-associated beta strand protein
MKKTYLTSLLSAVFLSLTATSQAANYTWTTTTNGTKDWNNTANWSGGTLPDSANDTSVIFFSDTTTALANGTQSITTNVPSALTLNNLTLNGAAPSSAGTASVVIGTNASTWTFDGTAPSINLTSNASAALNRALSFNVASNLSLNATTTITMTGDGVYSANPATPNLTYTFSGNITGTGGITRTAGGTPSATVDNGVVILSGNNSYSGATNVQRGELRLANNNALGNSSSITVGSTSINTARLTLTGGTTITGKTVTITNTGTSGDGNSYGALSTFSGTNVWDGDVIMGATGTRIGGVGGSLEITGVISGGGAGNAHLIRGDSSNIILSNTANTFASSSLGIQFESNTATGTVTVTSLTDSGSASSLGTTSTILMSVASGRTNVLKYTGNGSSTNRTFSFSSTGNGTFVFDQSGSGNLKFTGTINATTTGNHTLALGGSTSGTGEIAGNILDFNSGNVTSVTKVGTGTWTISGNTTYSGNTTVSAGTLLINGSTSATSAVSVASGATLGGNGTVGGATTISGNLRPGNSPGLLTFNSTLTLASTANTTMEINGSATRGTDYDGVNVTSALTYNGTLTLAVGTTFGVGTYSFNLFDFGSQSGNFSSVALTGNYTGTFSGPSSGNWTLTQANGFGGNNTWTFSHATGDLGLNVVPEPATWILLAGSLTAVVVFRRRRGTR